MYQLTTLPSTITVNTVRLRRTVVILKTAPHRTAVGLNVQRVPLAIFAVSYFLLKQPPPTFQQANRSYSRNQQFLAYAMSRTV
jgi:hypothetical protein